MPELKRTTGGLLELQKKSFSLKDFHDAVQGVESLGLDEATLRSLGLYAVKRALARPGVHPQVPPVAPRERQGEVLDVQLGAFAKR